ncbi:hypothetical protein [Arthrobacter sp. K5]|uniref:Pyridine nucleotide-disulphide oxidoreductase dimerisation domain-containing protein n=1 Tax=Arthrobacter sp. K5 TaxID=2839623 RepID=A0AAU8EYF8_9MICC
MCRVLPLKFIPRALVNRDTRGFIKIVADADTGRIVGITVVGKDAGDIAAAGIYILEAGMTVDPGRESLEPLSDHGRRHQDSSPVLHY